MLSDVLSCSRLWVIGSRLMAPRPCAPPPPPAELQDNNDGEEPAPEQVIELGALGGSSRDLCRAALRYIGRCHAILASMHGMRNCPVFHAAHRYYL